MGNCGQQHEPKQCPAYDQKCSKCRRRGYFARCCRKLNRRQRSSSRSHTASSTFNPTRSVDLLEDCVETLFVGELLSIISLSQKRAVFRNVVVNNTPISVKLDTGAECCLMTHKTYNTIPARLKLVPTDVLIKAYGMRNLIRPVGEAVFDVAFRGCRLQIIDTGEATLLGLDACEKHGLVHNADALEPITTSPLIDEYADVFIGLGAMPGEYSIAVSASSDPASAKSTATSEGEVAC